MELQMGRCVAGIRTDQWGGKHGHLALIINDAKLQTLTGDATMTVAKMAKPGNLPTGLTNTTPAIVKSRLMAQHRVDETNYTTMIVVEEVAVQKICTDLVEPMYVEELEDDYLGYKNKSIKEVIQYIRDTWCTVTTLEKEEALKEFAQPWRRGEEHVTAYCRRLDKQQKRCQDLGAAADDKTKIHLYVKFIRHRRKFSMFWVPRVGTRLVCKNELRHNKINTPLIICMLSKSMLCSLYWHPLNGEVLLGLLFRLCLWRHRPSVVMLVIIIRIIMLKRLRPN